MLFLKGAVMATFMMLGVFQEPSVVSLTVLTYNIHHGSGMDTVLDLDRIASIIREQTPDVVCLQEVDRGLPRTRKMDMPALLAEKLGMTCVFESNYNFDGGEYGNATLTKWPVISSRNIALPNPLSQEPRGCLVVQIEWEGTKLDVFNTHLGLNGQERLAQAEAIVTALGENPVILAGDMNENVTAPAMQRFTERLQDTFLEKEGRLSGTVPARAPTRRIDYILTSPSFRVGDAVILDSPEAAAASDHRPYKAVLSLRP